MTRLHAALAAIPIPPAALVVVAAAVAPAVARAQPADETPPASLFAEHRAAFMERMDGGLAVFPTTPEIPRNDDAAYPWRQDSDLWWLTGFAEPGAVAVLRPDAAEGQRYALFVRPKNPDEEVWTGRRTGVEGARAIHGAELAFPVDSLEPVLSRWLGEVDRVWYDGSEDHPWAHPGIDSIVGAWEEAAPGREILDADRITHELRLVKDEREVELLQRAIDITVDAHDAAMAAIRPGMGEWEVEALIEFVYRAHGAARVGFNSIVGSGPNTTILHYESNDRRMEAGELVLMDIGAEWSHYTADVTRTVPVSGTFSPEQRTVYGIVLDAQKAAIEIVRPGVTIADVQRRALEVVVEGLIREGFLEGTVEENLASRAYRTFLMHGISHWLGLDVHDVGGYSVEGRPRVLAPGMVFTVEPGVYIAEGTEGVDPRWWNIGVRIEDDVLVTEDGHRVLSDGSPREVEAIEAAMSGRGLPDVTTTRLEPDHAYIWVSHGAPEGATLTELGIAQWPDTVRPGEGVEWIGFPFENFFLELMWVSDEQTFRESWVSWHPPHRERANWRTSGASPFGLAFHRVDPEVSRVPASFQVEDWWDEQGGYVSDADARMPFLMLMGPRYAMPDPVWMTPGARALSRNPAGIRRLTSWTLGTPRPVDHEALEFLVEQQALRLEGAEGHVLELTFDEGRQGKSYDARPDLPLVIHY